MKNVRTSGKQKENKRKAAANSVGQKKNNFNQGFWDNKTEGLAENNDATTTGILHSTTIIYAGLLGGPSVLHNLKAVLDSRAEEAKTTLTKE